MGSGDARAAQKRRPFALAAGIVLVVAGIAIVGIFVTGNDSKTPAPVVQTANAQSVQSKEVSYKTLSGNEFRDLYRSVAYPNTQQITSPPAISDNPVADQFIQKLAEAQGYKLTSLPVSPIIKLHMSGLEGDDLLQPKAYDAWLKLKAEADKDSIALRILSAYRSPEYQRNLFMRRLLATGVSVSQMAAGQGEANIKQTLTVTAPPGYSRHHTGYTLDLACYPNGSFVAFKDSVCHKWVAANNYLVAKKAGWIPSYPDDAIIQGPEPEQWEYVWVGTNAVTQ